MYRIFNDLFLERGGEARRVSTATALLGVGWVSSDDKNQGVMKVKKAVLVINDKPQTDLPYGRLTPVFLMRDFCGSDIEC